MLRDVCENAMIVIAAFFIVGAAHAQQDALPPPELDEDDFRLDVSIAAGAWFPRLSGSAELAGAGEIEFDTDVDLRDSEITFNGELDFRFDRWHVRSLLYDFSADGSQPAERPLRFGDVMIDTGETARASFDQVALGLDVGYVFDLWEREELSVTIGPVVGVRYFDIEFAMENRSRPGTPRDSADITTLGFFGGARMTFAWDDEVFISAGGGVGTTLHGGFLAAIDAGVTWQPGGGPVGLSFGYRLSWLSGLESDDDAFMLDSRLAGLFAGVSVRF